jgi:large subunit ribosomal protein L23
MDINIYDVIAGPVLSDKAHDLAKSLGKVVLRVHAHANKPMVKAAVEALLKVNVKAVNMVNRSGKVRRVGRRVVQGSAQKIAIVTLAKGQSFDFFDQSKVTNAVVEAK